MGSDNGRSRRHTAPRRRSASLEQRDKRPRGDIRGADRRDYADGDRSGGYIEDSHSRSSRKRTRDQVSQVPAKRYRSRSCERDENYEHSNR